ncbi:MAG: serine/threonine protein kinase [Cognaticolwellia sp.]
MKLNPEQPTAPQDPLLGRVIADRYSISRLIARGGMGAVYEAEQRPLGRRVAVKVLQEPTNSGDSDAFQRRFFLEAATLAKLDHPNTVTLYDYGQTKDHIFYLVMEYVDGPALSKVLKLSQGTLEPLRVLTLMAQVTDALENAHRAGVVHRDLKPGNLLVTQDSSGKELLKVVDFGLVKLTEGDQAITVTGMIMGSPHCMAPEQVQGDDVDHRADVYAVGVLLFRCLAGRYPFHGATTTGTMIAHIQQDIPSLAKVAPELELPEGLERVIRRCLAKKPDDRFQSMAELGRVLRACIEVPTDQFSTVSTIMETAPTEIPHPRRAPWVATAAIAALLAVAGLAYGLTRPGPTTGPDIPLAPAMATVSLISAPAGATVLVDGERMGTTPLLIDLPPGGAQFELRLRGYDALTVRKELVAGQPTKLELNLSKTVETAPTKAVPTQPKTTSADKPAQTRKSKSRPVTRVKEPEEPTTGPTQTDPPVKQDTEPAKTDPSAQDKAPAGYKSNPFD